MQSWGVITSLSTGTRILILWDLCLSWWPGHPVFLRHGCLFLVSSLVPPLPTNSHKVLSVCFIIYSWWLVTVATSASTTIKNCTSPQETWVRQGPDLCATGDFRWAGYVTFLGFGSLQLQNGDHSAYLIGLVRHSNCWKHVKCLEEYLAYNSLLIAVLLLYHCQLKKVAR